MRTLDGRFDPRKAGDMPPGRHALGKLGLFLEVSKDGARRAWLQKVSVSGEQRWLTLGHHGEMPWREIEATALEHRAAAKRGIDPADEKRRAKVAQERATRTVADVLAAMREAKAPALAERTIQSMRVRHRLVERHAIGKVPIADLTAEDVAAFLGPLIRRVPASATKVQRGVAAAWDYAVVMNWADPSRANPAAWKGRLEHVLPAPARVRAPVPQRAVDWREIPAFWRALAEHSGTGVAVLRLAALTGMRTGEILGGRWSEIDFGAETWTIAPSRVKTRVGLVVPLSAPALKVLGELHAIRRSDVVLPGNDARRPASAMVALAALDRVGWRGRLVTHGLRSCLRSWAADNGVSAEVGEALLGHVPDRLVQVYRRTDMLDARRAVLAEWARFVTGAEAQQQQAAPAAA